MTEADQATGPHGSAVAFVPRGPRGLAPPVRVAAPPPLHELDEDTFEQLCRDVFAAEPNVATCNRYGTRGQRQLGIDLLADVRNSGDHQVAQCKCYADFPRRKIKEASDEFLKHLSHWRERRVVRFVLIVSEPLEKAGQQEQVIAERRRFEAVGIRYEAWSLHTLVTRLKPWPDIVERYIDQGRGHWVDRICGPAPFRIDAEPARATGPAIPGPSVEPQFAALMALASDGFSAKLDDCRALARKGLTSAAEAALAGLLSDATSDVLPVELRAKAVRLQASLAIDRPGGIGTAKVLLAKADRIDGTTSTRLQAQIVLDEQGPDACIEFLAANGDACEEDTNLRAVCHLRTGRPQQAIDLLEPLIADATSADPLRLLAFALASAGRGDEACVRARSALAREPDSWATRIALGVVLYTASLSPLATRGRIAGWPEPCDWNVVRRDDTSIGRLREAAEIFGSLCADRQERIDRETLQSWRLACLANDAERQADAESYCRDILRESPTNAAAIAWALARAFPTEGTWKVFDPVAASRRLDDLLGSGRGDILHLSVLASLLAWRGKSSKIAALLRRHQPRFAEGAMAESFAALQKEATLRTGGTIPDTQGVEPDRVEVLLALREDDAKARDRLVAVALRLQDAGSSDPVFVDAIFRLAALGFVREVAPFADRLVELTGTADAIRLAAHAKAMDGDYAGAVALLDARVADFPGASLPRNLRWLRAQCNEQLGKLGAAISEMQALRETGAGLEEILGLADMYMRRGDLALAAETISSVADHADISPEQALRFAHVLESYDPDVAAKLWRRAAAQELEPRLLPFAFSVARRLAIGPESATIIQKMTESAVPVGGASDRSPVVSMSIDQMLEFLRARRTEMERFTNLHEMGTVPLHILAPQMGWSLPRLFHELPLRRERAAATTSSTGLLLAVHGGRAVADQLPDDPSVWRLHLDVTAVLLAQHLGLLDAVESCFRPLRIPSHLVPTLLSMRGDLLDGSPIEASAANALIAAVEATHIGSIPKQDDATISQPVGALLERSAAAGGTALTWDDDARAANAAGALATNLSGVVASLEQLCEITTAEAADARARLGVAGAEAPVGATLARRTVLFCHANTIQELTKAGMLPAACRAFDVHVEEGFVTHLRETILDGQARKETAGWLDDLLERLNRGIQDGTYELLPIVPALDEEVGPRDGPIACLLDLLRIPPAEGNIVWIDDRALNAHAACGAAPLLGIADILRALRKYGRLTEEDCHLRLLRLRAGNVAFIDAWEGELEFWLRRAPVVEGHVVETEALATLRRYLGSCLTHERILQIPPMPVDAPNPGGEVAFVIGWQRAVSKALTSLWGDDSLALHQILAYSRWLMDCVSVDRYERFPVYQPTAEGKIAVLTSVLSTMLCGGFLLLRPFNAEKDRCGIYLAWLEAEVVGPRFLIDPAIEQAVAAALVTFLAARPEAEQEDAARVRRLLTVKFLDMLPASLKKRLMRDHAMLATLGADRDVRAVQIGKLTLPAKPYLAAIARALRGAAVEVLDDAGDIAAITASLEDGAVIATVTSKDGKVRISDSVNALLMGDEDARAVLSASGTWLDAPIHERRRHVDDLLSIPDKAERVLAAIDLRMDTAAAHFSGLQSRLGDGGGISFAQLGPPSAASLIRYLRLPAGGQFSDRLAVAATELIGDYGIDEAFDRLGSLPTPLPKPLLDAFASLGPREQVEAIARWEASGPTPIHRVHMAKLAAGLPTDTGGRATFEKQLSAFVTSATDGVMTTLAALLRAFGGRSALWPGMNLLSEAERIATCWVYSCEILRLVGPVVDLAELRDLAERQSGNSVSAMFTDKTDYRSDVACPQFIIPEAVLIWGIAHALNTRVDGGLERAECEVLANAVIQRIDGAPFPQGWLLDARFLRPNSTDSFMGEPIEHLVHAVTGTDVGKWYAAEAQGALLSHSLQAAGTDDAGLDAWRMVLCVACFAAVSGSMTDALCGALERTVNVTPNKDPNLFQEILRFAARQGACSGSPGLRATASQLFSALTPKLIDSAGDEAGVGRCVYAIMMSAIDLSRDGAGVVLMASFVALCRSVVDARPLTNLSVRRFLNQAARQVPFHDAEALWPLLIELRAR